tara:strand:+ start:668 stop:1537 length:870 start_codon:yes stop_codon:yes gene_type:complete
MAVATSTALTIAAIGGLATTATSAGMSFAQANKQKKAMQDAEADAEAAMAAARGKLDVNFAEQMSIKKEAYDLEREAMLVQGAMATEAGKESERGAAATAGRVYAAQQQGQAGIRTAMADELTNIEGAILEEDSRLRDLDVALDLEDVAGNQMVAADASRAATAAKQQGIQSTISAVGQAAAMAPLYGKNTSAQKAALGGMEFTPDEFSKFGTIGQTGGLEGSGQDFSNLDLAALGGMSNRDFKQFRKSLTPQQQNMLFLNDNYISNYQKQMQQPSNQYFGYNPSLSYN